MREILDGLPRGVALDAACRTGRHTVYLASLGYEVIGVDTSPEMLAVSREKVPDAEFYELISTTCRLQTPPSTSSSARWRFATFPSSTGHLPARGSCGWTATLSSPTRVA